MSITALTFINIQEVNPTPLLLKPLSYCGYVLLESGDRIQNFSSLPDNAKVALKVTCFVIMLIPILIAALIGIAGTFSSPQPTSITFTFNMNDATSNASVARSNESVARYIRSINHLHDSPTANIQQHLPTKVLNNCTDVDLSIIGSTPQVEPRPVYKGTIEVIPSKKTKLISIIDRLIRTLFREDHEQIKGVDIVNYMQLPLLRTSERKTDVKNVTKYFIRSFKSVTLALYPSIPGSNPLTPMTITLER